MTTPTTALQVGTRVRYTGPADEHPFRFTARAEQPLAGTVTGPGDESFVTHPRETPTGKAERLVRYAAEHVQVRWDPCVYGWNTPRAHVTQVPL